MEVLFDKAQHQYRVGGIVYPSVTQILKAAGLVVGYDRIDPAYAIKGTAVHSATEFSDLGTLDESTVDPEIRPHLAAWREFRALTKIVFGSIERRFGSALMYAGTVDRVVSDFGGKKGVLDIKSGRPAEWHKIQTAGYATGIYGDSGRSVGRWAIYLSGEGRFRVEEHTDPADFLVWQAALTVARWKSRNGIKEGGL